MTEPLDHLDHLARESDRFAEVIALADPDAGVPSCPDWTAADLWWHLAEVQAFWAGIVREGLTEIEQVEKLPDPPETRDPDALRELYARSTEQLRATLAEHPPATAVWTWSDDHSVGFIRRRQALEALIHRVDAELAAGDRTPMDPGLCSDGVDEVLRVMYGDHPSWGEFTPDPAATVRISASDTGVSWLVRIGRFVGTDPATGEDVDEPDIGVSEHDDPTVPAEATVTGSAADLVCWLWHRPPTQPLRRSGDGAVLERFEGVIAEGIE